MVITKEWMLKRKAELLNIEGEMLLRNISQRKKFNEKFSSKLKVVECLGKGISPFKVTGTALSEGTYTGISGKTNFYPLNALEEGVDSLIGKPIIWDHEDKKAQAIVGKVISAWIEGEKIRYEGEIYVQHAIDLIENGLINFVSAGFDYERDYSSGLSTVTELDFKELSLVIEPSCKDADIKPL